MPNTQKTYNWNGALIKSVREAAGLSRTELAASCGVTAETVRSWETNATAPYLPAFLKAAAALSCAPEDLLVAA